MMISQLRGAVARKEPGYAVIDVGGVGYKVNMTGYLLAELALGSEATLLTHLVVREDCLDLYGFTDAGDLRAFELLICVSGIGPKSALAVLNATTVENLRLAVDTQDPTHLTRVSGIGKKIAEKILLELRGKLDGSGLAHASVRDDVDVLEALRSLGYSQKESQDALKQVPKEVVGAPEKVKRALKILSR